MFRNGIFFWAYQTTKNLVLILKLQHLVVFGLCFSPHPIYLDKGPDSLQSSEDLCCNPCYIAVRETFGLNGSTEQGHDTYFVAALASDL